MDKIEHLAGLINKAERPVIHAGGGVRLSDASAELIELAYKAEIPVATTLMCLGCFPRRDSLSLGIMGMHGERESNLAVHNADLLLTIGGRFSDRVTGDTKGYARGATIVHIDIDRSEIDKNVSAEYRIVGDVKVVLAALLPLVKNKKHTEWLKSIESWKREIPASDKFTPSNIIAQIHEIFGDETIVCTDVGQHQMWTAQHWPFAKPRKLITSGGMGTMGFGLGAAIGAKIANPKKPVILITGDGSFRMNMNELVTCASLGLDIHIFVLANGTLGMVRQWQKLFWDKRFSATDLADVVDYGSLAAAFGLTGYRVCDAAALGEAINTSGKTGKTSVICCDVYIDENVWPIVPPGDTIENQRMEE
jgi:acetolactate synthase-1/2/3 large subunit